MLKSGTSPASGVSESCMAMTAPVPVPVVATVNSASIAWPKRSSLPSRLPADGVDPERVHAERSRAFRGIDHRDADEDEHSHRRQNRAALAQVADDAAEGEHGSDGNEQQRPDLQDVGPGVRVLEGMRRVGVHEAAAVGAELLIASWPAIGPIESVCLAPSSVVTSTDPSSVCGTPSASMASAITIDSGSST